MLDIVIPTYSINADLVRMAIECIRSYQGQYDRLIVSEDGGLYSPELMKLADTYIYNKENVGFSANVNRGWRYAQGDYVGIISSDTFLVSGKLKDLCIKGKVTSPFVINQSIDGLAGCFFVVHKSCPKYLIETMKTYYSDEEYKQRTKDLFVTVPSVSIYHIQAQTVKAAGIEGDSKKDREAYENLS